MTGLWAFEVQVPYQKYQGPPIVVRLKYSKNCLDNYLTSFFKNVQCTLNSRNVLIHLLTISFQSEFLEYWNTQKSVWRIWQRFSFLLDEVIPKIWKKLNSHDGFLSYLQNSTSNSAHLAARFCPVLVCPQKVTMKFNFFHIFGIPSSSRHEKCWQILQTLFWVFQYSRNSQCFIFRGFSCTSKLDFQLE